MQTYKKCSTNTKDDLINFRNIGSTLELKTYMLIRKKGSFVILFKYECIINLNSYITM